MVYNQDLSISNKNCGISDWLPPIRNKKTSDIKSNSWFDIRRCLNPNIKTKFVPVNNKQIVLKEPNCIYLKYDLITLNPSSDHIRILREWFSMYAKIYNHAINLIRKMFYVNNKLIKSRLQCEIYDEIIVRKLSNDKTKLIESLKSSDRPPEFLLDYAISHACTYCNSQVKKYLKDSKNPYNKKTLRFRLWSLHKSRRVMHIFPPKLCDKDVCNGLFLKLKPSKNIHDIYMFCVMSWDRLTGKFFVYKPVLKRLSNIPKKQFTRCGIDPGVRTFLTLYSSERTYDVCDSTFYNNKIKRMWRKIDRINFLLHNRKKRKKRKNDRRLRKSLAKYYRKIRQRIKDLHTKTAKYLVSRYKEIYIGIYDTSKNLSDPRISFYEKRRIATLNHELFLTRLQQVADRFGSSVYAINEHMTTKTCSKCGRINEIGSSKVHKCACGMYAGRDENAAKNILKKGIKEHYLSAQSDKNVTEYNNKKSNKTNKET
ncbi:putative transposase [Acanthamoeba polyphaga mimivirus]|uniref:Putative transposase n=1 Tax=Acanthamoeba polyphaga mimivirus TaxID=212035 RepID=A0A0G2Y008_MIMIV|nr:putative transposase [Acanthamoeba polyphaga mimivirus]